MYSSLQTMQCIVLANGIYDVVCGLCILSCQDCLAGQLHAHMFRGGLEGIERRLLAYWILTYGAMRVLAVRNAVLAATSYAIEGVVFAIECCVYDTMVPERAVGVLVCCLFCVWLVSISRWAVFTK